MRIGRYNDARQGVERKGGLEFLFFLVRTYKGDKLEVVSQVKISSCLGVVYERPTLFSPEESWCPSQIPPLMFYRRCLRSVPPSLRNRTTGNGGEVGGDF